MYYLNPDTIRTKLAIVEELAAAHRTTLELNAELDTEATARREAEIAAKGLRANHNQALRDLKGAQEAIEAQEGTLAMHRKYLREAKLDITALAAAIDGYEALLAYRMQLATITANDVAAAHEAETEEWQAEATEASDRINELNAIIDGLNAHAFNQAATIAELRNALDLEPLPEPVVDLRA